MRCHRSLRITGLFSRAFVRLLAELAVVFLGVSAAFIAESYRQSRENERRAHQIAAALISDLDAYVMTSRRLSEEMRIGLEDWAEANRRGERSPPFYYRIPGAERPPVGVWHAALQSQAADLLPAELLFELAFFYSEINGVADRYVRYSSFTEAEVLPRLRRGSGTFYPQGSAVLEPVFQEHMLRLEEIRGWMEKSVVWAEQLSDRLATVSMDRYKDPRRAD